MSYVRLDDQFPRHRKVLAAGPSSDPVLFYLFATAYASSQLTDGHISRAAVPLIGSFRNPRRLAERCVGLGLFDVDGDGWRIHDYLEHNLSAEQVRHLKDSNAERKRRERERHSAPESRASESPSSRRIPHAETPDEYSLNGDPSRPESRRESHRDRHRDSHDPSRVTLARGRAPSPTPTPDPSPKNTKSRGPVGPTPADLFDVWNREAGEGFPRALKLTPARERQAVARLRERPDLAEWSAIIARVSRSRALRYGFSPDRPWTADLDWLLQADSAVKILEGKYDNREPAVAVPAGRSVPDVEETQAYIRQHRAQDVANQAENEADARRRRELGLPTLLEEIRAEHERRRRQQPGGQAEALEAPAGETAGLDDALELDDMGEESRG